MVRFAGVGCVLLLATALASGAAQPLYEPDLPRDHPAIRYASAPVTDIVSALAAKLRGGAFTLAVDPVAGVVPSLLRQLDINVDSQTLVFSRTSFQHPLISPRRPRAVYFNDDVAVAVVPGASAIELAAIDPRQGVQFYTLQGITSPRPSIARREVCLNCHHGVATLGVPGMFVSSVFPSASGVPERDGAIVTDHRTPFEDRWGGWYVTGTHGGQPHRGNAVARNPAEPTVLETEGAENVLGLQGRFDPAMHLAATSDIVALMTLEHQTFALNLLTRLGWESRIADHDGIAELAARLDGRVREVVRYLLFQDEARFRFPVAGVSSFTKSFAARGPFDARGRTLRAFDLQHRLFRYPLSYVIYSRTFDALPASVRDRVYRGLYDALTAGPGEGASSLSVADRLAVLEIVRETKTDLPPYWREASASRHMETGQIAAPPLSAGGWHRKAGAVPVWFANSAVKPTRALGDGR